MSKDIAQLNRRWEQSKPIASGRTVIDIYGSAAMESWEGAEALIDAYTELEQSTGESPKREYIRDIMYFKIKDYWGSNLSTEQLAKLDKFLSKLSQ